MSEKSRTLSNEQRVTSAIEKLLEAEKALADLLPHGSDTVVDTKSGRRIFLQHAQSAMVEATLRQSRLLESASAIVFELSADGTILYVNESITKVTAYRSSELIGKNWWQIFCPAQREPDVSALIERFKSGDVHNHELEVTRRDGIRIVLEITSANRLKPDGSIRSILGLATDVTERNRLKRLLATKNLIRTTISELPTVSDALPKVLQAICECMDFPGASIWLFEEGKKSLRCHGIWHVEGFTLPAFEPSTERSRTEVGLDLAESVIKVEKAVWFEKLRSKRDSSTTHDTSIDDGLVSGLAFPMRDGAKAIGVIELLSSRNKPRDEGLIRTSEEIGTLVGQLLEGKRNATERDTFFKVSLETLCIAGTDGYFRRLNPAFEELSGYSLEELCAKPFVDFVHPDDRQATIRETANLAEGKPTITFENRYRCKDGSYKWLSWKCVSVGNVIYAAARDVTEMKHINEELKASEQRYNLVLESAEMGFWDLDLLNNTGVISNKHAEIFGYQGANPDWNRASFQSHVLPEDHDKIKNNFEAGLRNGSMALECRIRRVDGTVRWVQSRGRLYRNNEGVPCRMMGVISDVTDRKQTEESLKKAQESLIQAQKLESIGQLAGGIAHDFNNILLAIMGYANILQVRLRDNKELLESADVIAASAERGAEVTRQLLAFAHSEPYEKTRVRIGKLFEDAKALLSRSVDKKIDIKIRQEPSLWLIDGDSTQLFQVLMNLGINARDAMVGGGELIFEATNICIENNHSFSAINLKPGKYVCVAARDTGVGIPRDIQKKIFEPFFTTKEKGKGTGLGLAMVYGIVKSHGGAISLYSELGKGTEFRIYLPAADELETSQRLASSDEPDFYADKLKGRVILIADDEDVLRQYLRKVLEPLGAILLFAKDGKEAVDLFEAHKDKLDCAILDVIMPKMRGIDVYKELRRRSPRRIKVVFSSGYADNPEIADLLKGTDVDFIVKPFKLTALLRKLNL